MLFTTQIVLGLGVVTTIALAILVLKEKHSLTRTVFAVYISGVTFWTGTIFINTFVASEFLAKAVFASAAFFLVVQVWFAALFPDEDSLNQPFAYFISIIGTFFIITSFWEGTLFETILFHPNGYVVVQNGFLSVPYSLFVLACTTYPITIFWRKYRTVKLQPQRIQLKYLLIGFVVFFCVSTLTNSVLPVFFGIYFFNAIGPVFSLILAAFVFYIIWRHEFLDIKIIIQRGLVYLALSAPLVAAYFGLNFGLESLFSISPHANALLSAFVTLCVAAFALYAVGRYFEKVRLLTVEKEYAAQLEHEVRERTTHLKELQEYQRRMMDDISHAIQTPVTVIRSAMESARCGTPYEKTYHTVEKSSDDLSRLARDFLHLSKLESLPHIVHETFPLSDTVVEIAEYVGVVCEESGITLRQSIERAIPLYADKSHIEELVRNLLSNAIKYTEDSKRREIHIAMKRVATHIEIRVEDTGRGISPDALPRIFERFFRASDSPHGVGLGLSICKQIVELHDGTITAESVEGEGATFIVSLPAIAR